MSGMGDRASKGSKILGGMNEVTTSANVRSTEPPNPDEDPARPESALLPTKNATNASSMASTEVAMVRTWSMRTPEFLRVTTWVSVRFLRSEKNVIGVPIMSTALA